MGMLAAKANKQDVDTSADPKGPPPEERTRSVLGMYERKTIWTATVQSPALASMAASLSKEEVAELFLEFARIGEKYAKGE